MKNTLLFFLVLLLSSSINAQSASDSRLKGLDTQVQQLIEDYHAAGLAIAVVENGKTIYAKGFGYRDVAKEQLVDTNTIFGIGSVSKSFTASLLGILADKNQLSLRDRPRKHIPELRFYNATMDDAIKIKHILSHSTGIPRMSSESSCVLFQSENKDDLIPRLAHLKPEAAVGEQWLYSNYMYTVAGIIGERVTGKPWEENLSTMIFRPLEMRKTYANVVAASKDHDFSLGYAVKGEQPIEVLPENIPTRSPGGNIYSSISDMTKWVKTWLNKGKYNNVSLLSSDYVNEATSPQQIMWGGLEAGNPEIAQFTNYGYGWGNSNYKGYYKVEHSGGISGYTSNVVFFPKENLGVIVLTNQTTSNLAYRVTDLFVEQLLSLKPSNEPAPEVRFTTVNTIQSADIKTAINEQKPPSHPLKELSGIYTHPGYGSVQVSFKNGTLYADFPFTKFRLEHLHYNVFQEQFTEEVPLAMWPFMRLNFASDADGQINSLWINLDQEPVAFKRQLKGSITTVLKKALDSEGHQVAIDQYRAHLNNEAREYSFSENELNTLGYEYLGQGAIDKAIIVFQLNVETYPTSWNAYDSLGEGYLKKGENDQAISNYKQSIALNPENQNGISMLQQLGIPLDTSNLNQASETEQIRATLMDYIEGTANGEADRLKRAFHPGLNLYAINKEEGLITRNGQKYISIFEDGKKHNRIGTILSIDYENNAAVAKIKIDMPDAKRIYFDYLLLLKIQGKWTIIHKSYTYKGYER